MFPTHPFHVNVSMVGVFQQFGILYRSSQMHRFLLVHNCVCFLTERDVGFTTQVYFYIGNDSQHLCSSSKAQMTYQLVRMVTNDILLYALCVYCSVNPLTMVLGIVHLLLIYAPFGSEGHLFRCFSKAGKDFSGFLVFFCFVCFCGKHMFSISGS